MILNSLFTLAALASLALGADTEAFKVHKHLAAGVYTYKSDGKGTGPLEPYHKPANKGTRDLVDSVKLNPRTTPVTGSAKCLTESISSIDWSSATGQFINIARPPVSLGGGNSLIAAAGDAIVYCCIWKSSHGNNCDGAEFAWILDNMPKDCKSRGGAYPTFQWDTVGWAKSYGTALLTDSQTICNQFNVDDK